MQTGDATRINIYIFDLFVGRRMSAWLGSVRMMVFNATVNNISVILWQSVLLVYKTGVPRENHRHVASHWQILSHNTEMSIPRHEQDSKLTTLVVISTHCIILTPHVTIFVLNLRLVIVNNKLMFHLYRRH
jgi:hypothetical protein